MTAPGDLPLLRAGARIAVVNRADAAVRFVQAVRDHTHRYGTDYTTIALHTEEEAEAWFVDLADEAICLGPARVRDERTGRHLHSYLDLDRLAEALVRARADAVWVGWGFVSERADFAEQCARAGVVFLGPPAPVIRQLGDKVAAKQLAESVGVPVAPWSQRPVRDVGDAVSAAREIGYPLLAKAAAGGGGRGIRIVTSEADLPAALESVAAEAGSAFGDSTIFLERLVRRARHVEVQIAADRFGTVWALGVRDCTVQRRRQKMIEESGAGTMPESRYEALREHARMLARRAGYVGVGTVEFLYDLDTETLCFMEVNPRLQVEHGVTELTTGIDLVSLQLDIAAGRALPGDEPAEHGAAIEARVTAEDVHDGFRPSPGRIAVLHTPSGPGLRVDVGLRAGDEVMPDFDPLVMKVMAYGRDRAEALARLDRALRDSVVVIAGGATTAGFLLRLLADPALRAGEVDTAWVDGLVAAGRQPAPDGDLAVVLAAADLAERERHRDVAHLMSSAARGRPDLVSAEGRTVQLRLDGVDYALPVQRLDTHLLRVLTPDGPVHVRRSPDRDWVLCAGRRRQATVLALDATTQVVVAGNSYRITQAEEAGVVRAPVPAVVVQVRVVAGQRVESDDVLMVLESMKLEVPVRAAARGVVREVLVDVGSRVDVAQHLVRVEVATAEAATGDAAAAPSPAAAPVSFRRLVARAVPKPGLDDVLEALRRCLLGFDNGLGTLEELASMALRSYDEARHAGADPAPDALANPELVAVEREVLDLYARCADLTATRRGDDGASRPHSSRELLYAFLRAPGRSQQSLPPDFVARLANTLEFFGAAGLDAGSRLDEACYRLCCALRAVGPLERVMRRILLRWTDEIEAGRSPVGVDELARLAALTDGVAPSVGEAARVASYRSYRHQAGGVTPGGAAMGAELPRTEFERVRSADELTAALRTVYAPEELSGWSRVRAGGADGVAAERKTADGGTEQVLAFAGFPPGPFAPEVPTAVEIFGVEPGTGSEVLPDPEPGVLRWTINVGGAARSFYPSGSGWREPRWQGLHPSLAQRLELWRLDNFDLDLLASTEDAYLFKAVAKENPEDARLILIAEVRELDAVTDEAGQIVSLPDLERRLLQSFAMMRDQISTGAPGPLAGYNRVVLYIRPLWTADGTALRRIARRLAPATRNLGIDRVLVRVQTGDGPTGSAVDRLIHVSRPASTGMSLGETAPSDEPVRPLTRRQLRLLRLRRRGLHDPYEITYLLTSPAATISDFPPGEFQEYDVDEHGEFVPVHRPPGGNEAGVVAGVIVNRTREHPQMRRVILLGDPSRGLGALAEPECRRVLAALDLARSLDVPVEWFTVSSGARISRESGTENMDWVARVLRSIVDFTQAGGELNVVVTGVNVGAQPYFNAEATMLMHTRGALIMTAASSMLLTGKDALDFAGAVSAPDNLGIGGYDRVMGPNGQAQYWAAGLEQACEILLRHYAHTYRQPGETIVRGRPSTDPPDRDISPDPHPQSAAGDFATVGEIFSASANPERKKPFDVRAVMSAVTDRDCRPLERWEGMAGAGSAVVWDAHVGGYPVCLIGIESRSLPRSGIVSADGPETWTGATLFPRSSKKVARAINAASANRPVVVLANLAGFDGSPESLRELQLEYGAEIGRAVTNFVGPIVFCVLSRYHGGAFVVFSKSLNDGLEVIAVEGAKASVIGGSAAAAVVFAREVAERAAADPRTRALAARRPETGGAPSAGTGEPGGAAQVDLEVELERIRADVRATIAREFDAIHTVERAREVGSVDRIVPAAQLRGAIVDAIERRR